MELLEGIKTRKSYRAFKTTPVPEETMRNILGAAIQSPSSANTQPWEVAVVSGKKRDELSKKLNELAKAGTAANRDMPTPATWPPELDKRFKEHGEGRYLALGIERGDTQRRQEVNLLNYDFYGAPCALFLFIDKALTSSSLYDMGLFTQTIPLAAHSFGLGTCPQASVAGYPDAIRDVLGIPSSKLLVIGIAIGYPDMDAQFNTYQSNRVGMDTFTQWYT